MTTPTFTINGTECPAAVVVPSYGATITLMVLDVSALVSTTFVVAANGTGLSSGLSTAPTINNGVKGQATFTFPSDPGGGLGAAVGIECIGVDASGRRFSAFGIAGRDNSKGFIPPCANEGLWRHPTRGWLVLLDQIIAALP